MGILQDFQGKPYGWPSNYCGAVIHEMLKRELDWISDYPLLELMHGSEARMVAYAIAAHGSIGAAHDFEIMKAPGVVRLSRPHFEVARLLWCPSGELTYGEGLFSPILTDRYGAMLMRDNSCDPFMVWTPDGLRRVHPIHYGSDHRGWAW